MDRIKRYDWVKRGLILLMIFFLSSCSSTPQIQSLTQDITNSLPKKTVVHGLAAYPQKTNQCGPESLATLLSHLDINKSPDELAPLVFLPGRGGTLALDLVAQARQQGVLVYPVSPDIPSLLKLVAEGYPVLVMQNLGFNWFSQWHFTVVTGFDIEEGVIYLSSGERINEEVPFRLFFRTWKRAGFWGITILKPGTFPPEVNPNVYLKAAIDLESVGQSQAAKKSLLAYVKRWPANSLAWFALGNLALADSDQQQAIDYYFQALKLNADYPAAWNNLAYAFDGINCGEGVRLSLACGLAVAPDSEFLLETQRELITDKMNQLNPTLSDSRESCSNFLSCSFN